MENIFENIEAIRHKRGLKQEVIAKELGVTQSAYSNYVNRNEDIPLGRLTRIANILSVDVNRYYKMACEICARGKKL